MYSVLQLWASSDNSISLRNLLLSSLELAFFYSEDEVADHRVDFYWKELLKASHFIAASTQHFPAAVKMPRTS